MKKIFIILIIIVLTINFSSLSFADSIYVSNNKEAIKKNYIKAIDDISIEKNIIINSNFDVNKIKDDYYNNRAYFSEVVDNFIISADESGYSYSYSDEEYIYVVELIDGKKNEFKMEINNLKNQFLEGKYLDIVPKHMDYTEVHESNHAYFKYFTRVLSPTRVITLTISEGFFELNLESFSRTTSEIDKQAFEVKADLFLGQLKNANTLQSGIIDTLKSIADESFGDLISEVDKEDMTDIFAEQQERGYNTSDNTFRVTVTNIIQEVLTLSEFVDNTLNFVESGMSLAEHATLIAAYNNLNNYYNSFIIAE